MTALVWLGLALAGGVGAVLRFVIDSAVATRAGGSFPWGTLVVNMSGCLALGLVAGMGLGDDVYLVAGTGVVGAYTTYSTWLFESQRLAEERQMRAGLLNLVSSLVIGLLAVQAGHLMAGGL